MNKYANILKAFMVLLALLLQFSCELPGEASDNSSQKVISTTAKLEYTRHALCRMECRGVTEEEIREVLREGKINYQKSDPKDKPCPTYAIEDRVADGQLLRIVFATCAQKVKVVTCIDLEQEFECDCK
jgi:hypothetical protein